MSKIGRPKKYVTKSQVRESHLESQRRYREDKKAKGLIDRKVWLSVESARYLEDLKKENPFLTVSEIIDTIILRHQGSSL